MALSASDLQRRHELEGAPDPFPSLVDSTPVAPKKKQDRAAPLDTGSEILFPSLAPSAPAQAPAASAWGAGPRIKPVAKAPVFVDSFNLSSMDLSNAGKDGKPATLGEVMKQVMAKYKVKIDASANKMTRQTTFHVKAESQKELDKAKRSLLALLSPFISHVIQAPVSTIGAIVGPKGATLKQIRDQTSVRVDIPKRETLTPTGNGAVSGKASPSLDDEEDEPTVPVTLTGPQPLVFEAVDILKQIIASRTSRTTTRVRDIPAHVLPFVIVRKNNFIAAAQSDDITLTLNHDAREITASGDREAVGRAVDAIKITVEGFRANLTSLKITLPKRQHRLLAGKAGDEVLAKSKCAVVVPSHDEDTEELTVWGQPQDLPAGLSAVVEQANSKYIHEFPLPGPVSFSKDLVTFIEKIDFVKTFKNEQPDVEVFLPSLKSDKPTLAIDLIGEKANTDAVVKRISELIGKLFGGVRSIHIDWLLHKVVQGKNAKKLKQFNESHNVNVYFPAENSEVSSVLLVYDPFSPSASLIPDEKKKHLDAVEKELLKLAKDAADVKSEIISVEKRWHDAVIGSGGTTLNAIIGEDTTLSVKVGAEAGESSEDVILVRGISSDVTRVVKEILKIVEDAKNDEIVNSYSTEFEIDREYVGRIVGSGGAGVNKLRDQLGVKVDVSDEADEKEKESGKKSKKAAHSKSKIKITGRKENVEEAKKRILAQCERLADETSEVLKIPAQYHSSLIGEKGKYAIRLEDKYAVKITFPRHTADGGVEQKTREQLKADEVLVRGGRKGVAGAKSELLEALEYEKETNNTLKFTVPTRSVARILGRGGANINEIKNDTNTHIDVEKGSDDSQNSTITLRGTKKDIAAAKDAIMAIADQVQEEVTETVTIENKFHRSIIGAGGQGLKDLIARCGGPSDPKAQAGLIRFPRQGEAGDEVRLRGEAKVVKKLKEELEKIAADHRDRVILGVDIPSQQHRALIGRGGQTLNDLQNKFNVQIQFPGSRSYGQVGEPENKDDLAESDPANIVKVSGSRSNVEAALADLKSNVKPPMPEGVTREVRVPLKYQHAIANQGSFFRTLRNAGVQVDQSIATQKTRLPARPPSEHAPTARIDDADEDPSAAPAFEWQVVENYQDVEEGDSVWTLKGRDEAALDKAEKMVNGAIEKAAKATHVGFLTLADRSSFPRIVGAKGATVARLRDETGADITVSRENNTIIIVGAESEINNAKDAILRLAANNTNGRGPRRYHD